jgi:hypothetical protein
MRGIAHDHVLSVAGRVAFRLGQHGSAELAYQTAYYWEWLRAVPTDKDDESPLHFPILRFRFHCKCHR